MLEQVLAAAASMGWEKKGALLGDDGVAFSRGRRKGALMETKGATFSTE